MTAAWPSAQLADDTVTLWLRYFESVGLSEAADVAEELVLSDQWMPSIARFREVVSAQRRRQSLALGFAELDTSGLTPPNDGPGRIAELRRVLREGSGEPSDDVGGPIDCAASEPGP